MPFLTVNDVSVFNGIISMPLIGLFTADLVINQIDATNFTAGTSVTIKAENGITLVGTVLPDRTGAFLDTVHLKIIGGRGGFGKSAVPKGFVQPGAYVRDVLGALMNNASESLSSTITSTFLATNLTAWAIMESKVSEALKVLIDTVAPTYHWRVLSDGTLWIGAETWPSQTVTYRTDVHNPSDASFLLYVDTLQILPGVTIDGIGKIGRVEHIIMPDKVRTQVWTFIEDQERGLAPAITSLVQQATAHIDYFALYDARVVSQSGSMVDVIPVDSRLPGMSKVPLRLGIPGTTVQVAPGAILRIGWDRGNPQFPFAALWNGDETVTQITVNATMVNLGGSGGDALVKKTEYNTHTHPVPLGPGTSSAPTNPAIGTIQVKAV